MLEQLFKQIKDAENAVKTDRFIAGFRVSRNTWSQFLQRYPKTASKLIRDFVETKISDKDGKPTNTIDRNDLSGLISLVFKNDKPVQIIGSVGVGKSTTIKNLIRFDKDHVYVVFDSHNEYDFLPTIQTLTNNLTESARIPLPKEIAGARGLFSVHFNQILSGKWPDNYVIVLEESDRFKETVTLLKECRKFVKVLAVMQEPKGSFTDRVEIRD